MTQDHVPESLAANARLYAITDAARAGWAALFGWLADETGIDLRAVAYPPPAPLSEFWRRPDLGCVFMCGWPYARLDAKPWLLAAPVPKPARYGDRPIYFSDIVVHRDSPARTIADTFGGTVGWTAEDSNSGLTCCVTTSSPSATPIIRHSTPVRSAASSTRSGR